MSMSGLRKFNLAQVTAAARKKYPQIELTVVDETTDPTTGEIVPAVVVTFDPPQFWNDRAIDPKIGPRETALEVMGAEQLDKFLAAGGQLSQFNLVLTAYAEEQGASMGESSAS